jgi:hypothetical protein
MIITVDLDESTSHRDSTDLHSEQLALSAKDYQKYMNPANTFYKDYQSSLNSHTTGKLPKYSEMISKNRNICSSKDISILRSGQKGEASTAKHMKRQLLSPKGYNSNKDYFSPARKNTANMSTNFIIAPSNRKIKKNADSKSARQSNTRGGGRSKRTKKNQGNVTYLNSDVLLMSPSDNSYNDTYGDNLHHTVNDIVTEKSSKIRNRKVKDYNNFRIDSIDNDYTYDTNDRGVPDLRKAKSTKHKKKSSKMSSEAKRKNMYTSNGLKLDSFCPQNALQKDLSHSDVRHIDNK